MRRALRPLVLAALCAVVSLGAHGVLLKGMSRAVPRDTSLAVAEAALTREGAPVADVGAFFLRAELGRRPAVLRAALAYWSARQATYARIGQNASLAPRERVRRLVAELRHDVLVD